MAIVIDPVIGDAVPYVTAGSEGGQVDWETSEDDPSATLGPKSSLGRVGTRSPGVDSLKTRLPTAGCHQSANCSCGLRSRVEHAQARSVAVVLSVSRAELRTRYGGGNTHNGR